MNPTLLVAIPFTLSQPYAHSWHQERAEVDQGWLLVLEVDPADARPRQVGAPTLFVGAVPAERLSWSVQDEHLVVVAPGPLDLLETPIFWGSALLPEQVDLQVGQAEAAAAQAAGVTPTPGPVLAAARLVGGETRTLADRAALYSLAAEVITTWVPDQAERVAPWREPAAP